MEDEAEDRVIYQTYVAHAKLVSRFALRFYVPRPELLLAAVAICAVCVLYLQAADVWSRALVTRLQLALGRGSSSKASRLQYLTTSDADQLSWELRQGDAAAYAVQGRRPRMEDRFIVLQDIGKTGVSLFAIFDGHGGEFAANYAKDKLIPSLNSRIIELKRLANSGVRPQHNHTKSHEPSKSCQSSFNNHNNNNIIDRKKSFRKSNSTTDEISKTPVGGVTDPVLLAKIAAITKPIITREARPTTCPAPEKQPASVYIQEDGRIDYARLLRDEVLSADHHLVEAAKRSLNVAGSTALIAIIEGSRLIVANVGDSRGVLCDSRGNAIPLSFDHKPQQERERRRIESAGGSVSFNGVWRVAGILATSRALGDYPLKDRKLVIADPDVLSFDLNDLHPSFLVLASDGLWDTFSNEEAVAFIKERLDEPHHGARSITLQAFYRGSLDNITVLVVRFSFSQ